MVRVRPAAWERVPARRKPAGKSEPRLPSELLPFPQSCLVSPKGLAVAVAVALAVAVAVPVAVAEAAWS